MRPMRALVTTGAGPSALKAFSRRLAADGTLFDNGTVRVCTVPDKKGLGILAVKPIAAGSLVLQEAPMVRISKSTQTMEVKQHPEAGPLMQRVYALASEGKFNPRDFETWPAEVCANLERVLDIQAEIAFEKLDSRMQARWLGLEDSVTGGGRKTPGGILRTNGFDGTAAVSALPPPQGRRLPALIHRSAVRTLQLLLLRISNFTIHSSPCSCRSCVVLFLCVCVCDLFLFLQLPYSHPPDKHGCATMYEVLARVNHSCEPNAERIAGPLEGSVVRVVALTDIAQVRMRQTIGYLSPNSNI